MAKNFYIAAREGKNRVLTIQLFGDFDASSAWELINLLDDSIDKPNKLTIDTNGLRVINDFGLSVFLPRLSRLNKTLADVEVVGKFSNVFQED